MSVKIDPETLVNRSINRHYQTWLKFKCPFCGHDLQWRWSTIKKGAINTDLFDIPEKEHNQRITPPLRGTFPTHDDQTWKCPHCFFVCTFGVPITNNEYEQELKDRGGQVLMPDLFVANKDMYNRLKALGYLD